MWDDITYFSKDGVLAFKFVNKNFIKYVNKYWILYSTGAGKSPYIAKRTQLIADYFNYDAHKELRKIAEAENIAIIMGEQR